MIELPENIDELHQIRRELKEEEELLNRMVFKIEKQLHALEVILKNIYKAKYDKVNFNFNYQNYFLFKF